MMDFSKKTNQAAEKMQPQKVSVRVDVDVTKIVKYLSLAGIAIVGIIFGTSALRTIAGAKCRAAAAKIKAACAAAEDR